MLKNIVVAVRKHFERRQLENRLMQMTDRDLRDIGLSRADIHFVVRNGRMPANDPQPLAQAA